MQEADEDCRRKGALLKQLEARLADISMGSEEGVDGQGGMSDIVRHWQEQVAVAEDRAVAAAAEHAENLAITRDDHARCVATFSLARYLRFCQMAPWHLRCVQFKQKNKALTCNTTVRLITLNTRGFQAHDSAPVPQVVKVLVLMCPCGATKDF